MSGLRRAGKPFARAHVRIEIDAAHEVLALVRWLIALVPHRKVKNLMTLVRQEPAEVEEVALGPSLNIEEFVYLEDSHLLPNAFPI